MTRFALRRPKRTLAAIALAVLLVSSQGAQLERRLDPPNLTIPGTESARAGELASESFGEQLTIPILLRGPPRALDRQGPRLARALARDRRVTVLSPWDRTRSGIDLRPSKRAATLVVFVRRPPSDSVEVAMDVREVVRERVERPVRAHVTGQAPINLAIRDANFAAARKAEVIALPVLLIVLLLVFRSPVAAAIPAVCGGATVLAGFGVLSLLALVTSVQPLAVSLASMIGLALGIDYSLLILSRFREELDAGADVETATLTASVAAGRTVVFAGSVLLFAIAAALLVVPGSFLLSAIVGVLVVTAIGLGIAVVGMPAALVLLGANVNRWVLWTPRRGEGFFVRASRRVTRRAGPATAAILALLLALSAPALGLDPVPPGVSELPPDDPATRDYRAVSRAMGPGWGGAFEMVAVVPSGTVADQRRLRQFQDLQERIARDPDVADVVGPGDLVARTAPLRRLPGQLDGLTRSLERGRTGIARFQTGLGQAGSGVSELRDGLAQAAAGADALAGGGRAARDGAAQVRLGVVRALEGSEAIEAGLRRAITGADALATGAGTAEAGATRIAGELRGAVSRVAAAVPATRELASQLRAGSRDLGRLQEPASIADEQVGIAYEQLLEMTVGKADPRYLDALRAIGTARGALTGRDPVTGAPVAEGYDGLVPALREAERGAARAAEAVEGSVSDAVRLRDGLDRLADGAGSLAAGLGRLREGNLELAAGLAQLAAGGDQLGAGLARLGGGAGELQSGLGRLAGGGGRLASALGSGHSRSGALEDGIARLRRGADQFASEMPKPGRDVPDISGDSPGMLRSGYLTLAALSGARADRRQLARLLVNVEGGGRAGRVLIIPRTEPQSHAAQRLADRLEDEAAAFGRRTGFEVAAGGEGRMIVDFDRVASSRLPLIMGLLAAVTTLLLVPVFRSLVLPVVAVLLNLLTVAAAFGALVVLFQGPDAPAGGPGDLFVIPVLGIFTIVYGLSIDYEVFILSRMREGWLRTRDAEAAIEHGIRHTAGVVTGAAAIMTAVFLAFASTGFFAVRELGVGLAIAVALDATVVRLLLLPAVMRVLGPRAWWLPRRLDRLVPHLDVEAPAPRRRASAPSHDGAEAFVGRA